jgi:2-methylaconitate cis-trans-isomerase PrpF
MLDLAKLPQTTFPAVFMRGGTSRAIFFHRRDLPPLSPAGDHDAWDPIFLAAMGSPDPNGRQLNGLGGGVSSLSKVAIIGPPTRPDADIDYTFAQIGVTQPTVGYRGNCGNISSAVGPFAIDEGLIAAGGDEAVVRIHNTNTKKVIVSRFALHNGKAAVSGDFVLPGVAGTGAPIRLAFLDPSGAATGKLLPTGRVRETLALADGTTLDVSLIDAGNPTVFVAAQTLGLSGRESPADLNANPSAIARFEEIRVAAAQAMGLVASENEARSVMKNLPLVGIMSAPLPDDEADVVTRMISAGNPHGAIPLTGAMCLVVAANVPGSIVHDCVRASERTGSDLLIGHASGVLPVAATVRVEDGVAKVVEAVVYRTARRLMEGAVFVP